MSQNVGQIDLGLGINQRSFNRQLNGIASGAQRSVVSAFSGLGKAIGVTLGIKAIASFGKSCLKLGSDLSEVQNVVDVTFGDMAQDVNNFASTAIEQFGLSETAAKRYTGTMGAMLKSSGLTTAKALEMSKAITGLSADMASFYNLESEQAFEKIRSGISGETEPLKQLGINMSVANLEAYAMAEGISKAYSKMTQQEQTLLRYNYLLSVTKDAQGDFARTSDSWANQTRILAEQFNALKAAIGQGLIAAFTPIVKGLNIVIGKLRVAAGYFKAFMELIFGKQSDSGGSGIASVADDTSAIVDSATGASDAVEGVGDAAKKAGKKAKGALASFDELNQLSISDGSGSDSGTGGSGIEDMGGSVDVDLGKVDTDAEKLGGILDGVLGQLSTMKDLFSQGFEIGLGDKWQGQVSDIKSSIQGIKSSLKDIFTDSDVIQSAKGLAESIAINLGKVSGAAVSIGTTVAQNLTGGIDKYLAQNTQFIKDRIVGILNVAAEISTLSADFAVAFADIFSVFGGETSQQITADFISMFSNAFLTTQQLGLQFGADLLQLITQPIVENKGVIKTALEGTLSVLGELTGTVSKYVTDLCQTAIDVYSKYIGPAYDRVAGSLTSLFGNIVGAYNEYILPMLNNWADEFQTLYDNYIGPVMTKAIEIIGKLAELVSVFYANVLEPIVSWLVSVAAPLIVGVLDNLKSGFDVLIKFVMGALDGLLTALDGLITFLTGVFTGDWSKAWEGIKTLVSGAGQFIYNITIKPLKDIGVFLAGAFKNSWNASLTAIKNLFSPLGSWFSNSVVNPIKNTFNTLWNGLKSGASGAFNAVGDSAKKGMNWIIGHINNMINKVNSIGFNMPDVLGGGHVGFSIPNIPKLARGGVIDQPTLAMVGEAGKEAVVPLQNNTEWTGQVASLLASALLPFMQGSSGGDMNREIVFNLGDVELARAFLPSLIREADRQGVTIGG